MPFVLPVGVSERLIWTELLHRLYSNALRGRCLSINVRFHIISTPQSIQKTKTHNCICVWIVFHNYINNVKMQTADKKNESKIRYFSLWSFPLITELL